MELQAWPVLKPNRSDLNCLSSLWLAFFEGMIMGQAISLSLMKRGMNEMGHGRIS
jgi:hypothetical protein